MNNIKKIFSLSSLFAIMLLVLPCLIFSGCGTNDISIQNGAYKVTSFLVDNVEDDSFVGTYYTLNNGVMTSPEEEGEITYTVSGENLTFTFPDNVVFTGEYNNGTITLSNSTNGHSTVVTMVYTADITVPNGAYKITSFLEDNTTRDEFIGKYYVLNNGNMTSPDETGTITYVITGESIRFIFPSNAVFTGEYNNGTITLTHAMDGHSTVVTMVYTADITVPNGAYRITSFLVDDTTSDEFIGKYYILNNGNMTSPNEVGTITYVVIGESIKLTFPDNAVFTGAYNNGTITFSLNEQGHSTVVTMVFDSTYVQE